MGRKKASKEPKEPKPKRRQLGILFSDRLWTELRIMALRKKKTATELIEEAVKEYLERHGNGDNYNVI